MEVKLGYKGAGGWTFGTEKWVMECRSAGMDKAEAHRVLAALTAYPKLVEALRDVLSDCVTETSQDMPQVVHARALLREIKGE